MLAEDWRGDTKIMAKIAVAKETFTLLQLGLDFEKRVVKWTQVKSVLMDCTHTAANVAFRKQRKGQV